MDELLAHDQVAGELVGGRSRRPNPRYGALRTEVAGNHHYRCRSSGNNTSTRANMPGRNR